MLPRHLCRRVVKKVYGVNHCRAPAGHPCAAVIRSLTCPSHYSFAALFDDVGGLTRRSDITRFASLSICCRPVGRCESCFAPSKIYGLYYSSVSHLMQQSHYRTRGRRSVTSCLRADNNRTIPMINSISVKSVRRR
jgi:hypothetical protein